MLLNKEEKPDKMALEHRAEDDQAFVCERRRKRDLKRNDRSMGNEFVARSVVKFEKKRE